MEKISFPPLIAYLKEHSDLYNQQYQLYQMKYGTIDSKLLSFWILSVVEPIIKKLSVNNEEKLGPVFKILYTELLELLGNKSGIIYEKEYHLAWSLCSQAPTLMAAYPGRMIKAIHSAIESIRTHQPENVLLWIEMMEKSIVFCQTIEELLSCGRINAWMCGMAHLRKRAYGDFEKLSVMIKESLEANLKTVGNLVKAFTQEWVDLKTMEFIGEVGGFIGYGGSFKNSPLLAKIGGEILVTDRHDTFAFFGDAFGRVILPNIPIPLEKVIEKSTKNELDIVRANYGIQSIPFDDITSCVIHKFTLVVTRSSSHYLYVYGLPI